MLTAAAGVYLLSFLAVVAVSRSDQRVPADAIVVLGAAQYDGRPSPVFAARLDHAVTLFTEGWTDLIVVTGGIVPGDRMSEATAGRSHLVAAGIPADRVVVQPEGRTTAGSMDAVAAWLVGEGLQRVILVSDPFHLARLRLEARRLGLVAFTSPTPSSPISLRLRLELPYLLAEGAKLPVIIFRSLLP
ncbi:MAG: YdcF family protein [Gemmatimonadales bacterium]|nr:YdcF family protein [Gemmatimonadales bacterium]MDZ4258038.1 YdcF family protein [Gemmatimonadales bacterium]MDZ4390898.1 YdcF family protein [Gemmatimonadales bacterium]PKL93829.1 MAG: YdcF family protein [Gemmatimonadetes bacterium HGW-Gemmatimonadetes-1]